MLASILLAGMFYLEGVMPHANDSKLLIVMIIFCA